MRAVLRMLVPRDWTGEQALVAARVLRQALDAVWSVHGDEMAAALGNVPYERWMEFVPDEELGENDIPF